MYVKMAIQGLKRKYKHEPQAKEVNHLVIGFRDGTDNPLLRNIDDTINVLSFIETI